MDKLKYVKLENEDGSYTSSIPLAVDSNYVDVNGNTLTNELANKATKIEVQALASGSPAGVYSTVSALTTADPDHSKIYVVTADGHWYYYDGSAWVDGGVYQATTISENSIVYNQLNNELKDVFNDCYNVKQVQRASEDGFFKFSTGTVTQHASFNYMVFNVQEGERYYYQTRTRADARAYVITDLNDNVLEYHPGTASMVYTGTVTMPKNASKLYINVEAGGTETGRYIYCVKNSQLTLDKKYPLKNNYALGYVNADTGNLSYQAYPLTTHSIVNVVPIYLNKGDVICSEYSYTLARYNADGSFVSGSRTQLLNYNETIEIDGYYRIALFNYNVVPLISTYNTDSLISDKLSVGVTINKKYNKACYLHISFDDVYACLYDITVNASTYNSIFDNSFFSDLKDLHEQYGCVFTLNTFNKDTHQNSYDISTTTNKFRYEFNQNSDWLKFSFHAEDNNTYYNQDTSDILTSYNKFVNSVLNFGTYNCIDNFIRLGFFTGSSTNIDYLTSNSCNYKIHGLFTADDTRNSYYLSSTQQQFVNDNVYTYDKNKNIYLIKSQTRLENLGDGTINLTNYNNRYICEIFTHEQRWSSSLKTKLEEILRQAVQLNYNFIYFEEILQLRTELPE